LPAVKRAERLIVDNAALDHEYLPIEGLTSFTDASARFILGKEHPAYVEKRFASVQAISGTGALRFGAEFLSRFKKDAVVYVSNPTWGNHKNIFSDCGFKVKDYRYWDAQTNSLDLKGMLEDIEKAADGSIILLHACAHNPTGVDPTEAQWKEIADLLEKKKHLVFFDSAYQGFASGDLDKDAFAVRYFATRKLEFILAMSYSKNFGLYNERCGSAIVVMNKKELVANVRSQFAKIARPMISNPPAFGARIVDSILNTPELFDEWVANLKTMSSRIIEMRTRLRNALEKLKTPGTWNHITDQIGMFSYTGLTRQQCQCVKDKFHVYLTENGRISMAGLNSKNVEYVAEAFDYAVRNFPDSSKL